MIVIEGPDNAGKSTLAKYISERLNLPVRHSGGPSKYPGEIYKRIDQFHNDQSQCIYDRHPCVSQNLYLKSLKLAGEAVDDYRLQRFYATQPLIIYCRGRRTMKGHQPSEHGAGIGHTSAHYEAMVAKYIEALCDNYDRWAMKRAHIFYRIGDDMDRIVHLVDSMTTRSLHEAVRTMQSFDPWRDIEDFHKKYGLEYNGKPRMLPEDMFEFRRDFSYEEVNEYARAGEFALRELAGDKFDSFDNANFVYHLEQMFDACIDAVYVILGNAYLHGFNFKAGWKRVHTANMQKVRTSKTVRGKRGESKYDVIKPPGWQPPKHTDLIEDHAHREIAHEEEARRARQEHTG